MWNGGRFLFDKCNSNHDCLSPLNRSYLRTSIPITFDAIGGLLDSLFHSSFTLAPFPICLEYLFLSVPFFSRFFMQPCTFNVI